MGFSHSFFSISSLFSSFIIINYYTYAILFIIFNICKFLVFLTSLLFLENKSIKSPNINNDFNNYKPNSSHIGILPGGSLNDYNDYSGENQMYITLDVSTGYKVAMKIPVEKTLEDLFKE